MPEQIYCSIYRSDPGTILVGWYWWAFKQNLRTGSRTTVKGPLGPFRDRTEAEANFHNWIRMQSDLEVEFVE